LSPPGKLTSRIDRNGPSAFSGRRARRGDDRGDPGRAALVASAPRPADWPGGIVIVALVAPAVMLVDPVPQALPAPSVPSLEGAGEPSGPMPW
jgi:hypothetical protein